jgi:hypothetical protein
VKGSDRRKEARVRIADHDRGLKKGDWIQHERPQGLQYWTITGTTYNTIHIKEEHQDRRPEASLLNITKRLLIPWTLFASYGLIRCGLWSTRRPAQRPYTRCSDWRHRLSLRVLSCASQVGREHSKNYSDVSTLTSIYMQTRRNSFKMYRGSTIAVARV